MSMLLSIIIPTYNSAAVIKQCLDSILSQTFNKYEVLVLDAMSSDDTVNIVNSYIERFPDRVIKILSEKDAGIYDAMNKGILKAEGEWLYFLGSDDTLHSPHVLSDILTDGSMSFDVVYGNVISSRFGGVYDGEFNEEKILALNISHQAIFFKRRIFQITGLFNLKYRLLSDWDHNFKWFLNGSISKKFVDIIVATYADNGQSSCLIDWPFEKDRILNYMALKKGIGVHKKIRLLYIASKTALYKVDIPHFIKVLFKAPFILLNA